MIRCFGIDNVINAVQSIVGVPVSCEKDIKNALILEDKSLVLNQLL